MSLLQLLSVSHSFKETSDRPGVYRMGARRVMPRFEGNRHSAHNAFREPARTARSTMELQSSLFSELVAAPSRPVAHGNLVRPSVGNPTVSETEAKAEIAPVLTPKVEEKTATRRETKPEVREYASKPRTASALPLRRETRNWKYRVKEWLGLERHQPVTPLQAELALENVKVVRNELKDTDMELVESAEKAAQVSASKIDGKTAEAAENRKAARWIRLTARMFGSTKNEFSPKPREVAPRQGTLIPKA